MGDFNSMRLVQLRKMYDDGIITKCMQKYFIDAIKYYKLYIFNGIQ